MANIPALIPDTAEEVMVMTVPTAQKTDSVGHILTGIAKGSWDDIEIIYVTSEQEGLVGIIPIHLLLISDKTETAGKIMKEVKLKVHPHTDREKLVVDAIHRDVTSVPVVDQNNHLLGAVTSDQIIDILHDEHLEDLLHTSGIHGKISHTSELINGKLQKVILARLPWLVVGLGIGFVASLIISRFETFLNRNVEIAFFITMVTYMAGAMSTQSEIMFIRALTVMKFNITRYLIRELYIGIVIGGISGFIAGVGAFFLSHSVAIAFAVGSAMLVSMSLSTVVACLVPLMLRAWGKDPAIGSGPFATALQDLVSISVYFVISLLILRSV